MDDTAWETRVGRQRERFKLLSDIAADLLAATDPDQMVSDIFEKVSRALGLDVFFNFMVDGSGRGLTLDVAGGVSREVKEAFARLDFGEAVCGTVAQRGEGMVVGHVQDSDYDKAQGIKGIGVRSYACQPLMIGGRLIGTLSFGSRERDTFDADDLELIRAVAHHVALAKERIRSERERERLLAGERAAREEAERAGRLKDEFLATLSHELRTPLNAILGWSQMLRMYETSDRELDEGLAVIERNTRAQIRLVDDLLDMSRIVPGRVVLDVGAVDLADVIAACVATLRPAADAKRVRVATALEPGAGAVRGDAVRLQQCVWNLLSNAIKFTPAGGQVRISLRQVDGQAEIVVSDNGEGIRPDFLPHVFERFRQGDASSTRRHGGLGLGLAIVKHLVELHDGTVRGASGGEGRGASFTVTLPVAQPDGGPASRASPGAGSPVERHSLAGITVLVVDDEPDTRDILRLVLERFGARVELAATAREGLRRVRDGRPGVILSDIGMPEDDGYWFIRAVRALDAEAGGRTPAAALTAFAHGEDRARALTEGYQMHMTKPVEPAALAAVVRNLAASETLPGPG